MTYNGFGATLNLALPTNLLQQTVATAPDALSGCQVDALWRHPRAALHGAYAVNVAVVLGAQSTRYHRQRWCHGSRRSNRCRRLGGQVDWNIRQRLVGKGDMTLQ